MMVCSGKKGEKFARIDRSFRVAFQPQFTAKDVLSINNIASLLKSYLQALPEPVMTHKARPLFLEAVAMEEGPAKVARFADLLLSLPTASRSTSLFLLAHMLKVRQEKLHIQS